MITILIGAIILLLLFITIKNKNQRSMDYLLIIGLIIGVYLILKKNKIIEGMAESSSKEKQKESSSKKEKKELNNKVEEIYKIKSKVQPAPGNWESLKESNAKYQEFKNELDIPISSISVRKGICPGNSYIIEDNNYKKEALNILKTNNFFFKKDKENCYKIKSMNKKLKIVFLNKEVDADNFKDTFKDILKDFKLEEFKKFLNLILNIEKDIIDNTPLKKSNNNENKNIEIKQENNMLTIKVKVSNIFLQDKLYQALHSKFYEIDDISTEKTINSFKSLSDELKLKDNLEIQKNSYKITKQIQGISVIDNFTYIIQDNMIKRIKNNLQKVENNNKPTTINNKQLLHQFMLKLKLNQLDKGNYNYFIDKDNINIINKSNIINFSPNEWNDINYKNTKYIFEDLKDKITKEKYQKLIDMDYKNVTMISSKSGKKYVFTGKDVIIVNKNDYVNTKIKEVLEYDIDILASGFYLNNSEEKIILIAKQDIYFTYDPETDKFSKPLLTDKDLNILFYLDEYKKPEIACNEYAAVLGELVRNKNIENTDRKKILEGLDVCKKTK